MSGTVQSWCRVGAKVVCVSNVRQVWSIGDTTGWGSAVEGEIYTITEVRWSDGNGPTGWFLVLAEFNTRHLHAIYRFRPLVTIEDDIATHFATHLRQPRKIVEDA